MEKISKLCPKPCTGIYYWEQPDQSEAILVKSIDQSKLLNPTGRLIWNLCDGIHDRQDILDSLKDHFGDVEENTLADNLDEFLDDLCAKGYLWIPGSTT
jgi:hypothetical protein